QVWFAVCSFLFYFSTTEWCHCQRDVWMLPFALAALHFRLGQLHRLSDGNLGGGRLALFGILEGVCWGAAFWIKPFVALPALVCWALSAIRNWRDGRRLIVDAGALLIGGVLAGLPGVVWLLLSGAWSPMWDIFLHWNPEYIAAAEPFSQRLGFLFFRL